MAGVKNRLLFITLLLVVVLGLIVGIRGVSPNGRELSKPIQTRTSGTSRPEDFVKPGSLRTKASNREPSGPRATHAPERLKEFMLPEVAIDGLTLSEALRKLMGIYEDACERTGETALRLTFDIPPGNPKKLHLKLSPRNFTSSVQLLATFSGMSISRSKLHYRFEPFADERKQVTRALQVPPDFTSTIAGVAPEAESFTGSDPPQMPIGELMKASGLGLDPSTQLSLTNSGRLNIDTTSSADMAMISALVDILVNERPMQQWFTQKVIEIPSGMDWTPPDVSQMTEGQVQFFLREMSQKAGVNLMTLPSVTARNGQSATIELARELIIPVGESGHDFETHNLGQVMQVRGDALGFGHELALNYTDTTGDFDATTRKANINKRVDMMDSGFTSDGGTRLVVQTRPDGSRSVVLVTSTMIDATGRPVSDRE